MKTYKRLRIAFFTDDFYPASGGIGRSIQTQINELVRLGHDVTLFAPKHFLERPDNCQAVVVPSYYLPGTPSHMCILRHSRRLARRYAQQPFDVVHSQTERGGLMLAARIAKLQNIPHIHTFHANLAGTHASQPIGAFWGSVAYFLLVNPAIALISEKKFPNSVRFAPKTLDGPSFFARFDWHSLATVASRVDAYTAPAKFMIERISDCSPALENRGHIIPTGVNEAFLQALKRLHKTNDHTVLRFVSICRLAPEKRVDAIISAFITANLPNTQLDIVGAGSHERALRTLAFGHDNITFHGQASSLDQVAQFYQSADVFVLASHNFDTQAITIAEAVSAGLPIVYCDPRLRVGIDQKNSILAASPSSDDLARAMTQMANHQRRQQMAAHSRRLASTLGAETMAKKYIDLYHHIKTTSH